jgi:hypothetical protein
MWPLKLLAFLLLAYLLVLAAIFFAQTALLFPARMAGPPGPLPPGAQRLELDAATGERLHGLHIAPARPAPPGAAAILGFAGNAWNGADAAAYLHDLFPDRDVIVFHYRGYAPSAGRPSAAALLADAPLVHDFAAARLGGRPIVAMGFSIGTGVAAHLAARRPVKGAILVTPFDSLAALAAGHYRWLPVRLLLRHRMEPAEDLRSARVPVAIIAAQRDTLIPAARTRALAAALPNLVFDRTIPGAGHNDIYQHPAFRAAIREALGRIED